MWFAHPGFQIPFQIGVALLGAWFGTRLSHRPDRVGRPLRDPAAVAIAGGGINPPTKRSSSPADTDLTDDPVALGSLVLTGVVVAGWVLVQLRPWLLVGVVTVSSLAVGAGFGVVRRGEGSMPTAWGRWWAGLVALTVGAGVAGAYQLFAPLADPLDLRWRWEQLREAADSGITALLTERLDVVAFVGVQFLGVVVLVLGMLFVAGAATGLLAHGWSAPRGRGVASRFATGTRRVWSRPKVLFRFVALLFVIGLVMVSGVAQTMFIRLGN